MINLMSKDRERREREQGEEGQIVCRVAYKTVVTSPDAKQSNLKKLKKGFHFQ